MTSAAHTTDGFWQSQDGLRLHYRAYDSGAGQAKPPILCIPGLTRNVRDWAPVAERLATDWRVICISLRGRGQSGYAPDPQSYAPLMYLQDIEALVAALKLDQFIAFGTSLGGIITMLIAATHPQWLAGALLNDIGPVIEQEGLDRIKNYVGNGYEWADWAQAAHAISEANAHIYPDYTAAQWLSMAQRLCIQKADGRIAYDYDPLISEAFKQPSAPVDMWPMLEALKGVPSLIVRGALSDLFSDETAQEMRKRLPLSDYVLVPNVGHAPVLDEPEATQGIDRLLRRIG